MPGIRRGFELRRQKENGFLGLLLHLRYLKERRNREGRRKVKVSSLLFGKMKTPPLPYSDSETNQHNAR